MRKMFRNTEKASVKLCKIDRTDAKDRKSSKNLRIEQKVGIPLEYAYVEKQQRKRIE